MAAYPICLELWDAGAHGTKAERRVSEMADGGAGSGEGVNAANSRGRGGKRRPQGLSLHGGLPSGRATAAQKRPVSPLVVPDSPSTSEPVAAAAGDATTGRLSSARGTSERVASGKRHDHRPTPKSRLAVRGASDGGTAGAPAATTSAPGTASAQFPFSKHGVAAPLPSGREQTGNNGMGALGSSAALAAAVAAGHAATSGSAPPSRPSALPLGKEDASPAKAADTDGAGARLAVDVTAMADDAPDAMLSASMGQLSITDYADLPRAPSAFVFPSPANSEDETESAGVLCIAPPACLDHVTPEGHQESAARLLCIAGSSTGHSDGTVARQGGVLRSSPFASLRWIDGRTGPIPSASIGDILRVHDFAYVKELQRRSATVRRDLEGTAGAGVTLDGLGHDPRSPRVGADELPRSRMDLDTVVSPGSYRAAVQAAGAVVAAVDHVASGRCKRVFVATRPPGHHAGPSGAVPSAGFHSRPDLCSGGFCLLNNVAIGAAYARATYGRARVYPAVIGPGAGGTGRNGATGSSRAPPVLRRIAIVDFDIHHGNGTEAIVRNLVPHKEYLPLPSSWAPQSYESYKPWFDDSDADEVLFASIHLWDGDDFYPGSGSGTLGGRFGCEEGEGDLFGASNYSTEALRPAPSEAATAARGSSSSVGRLSPASDSTMDAGDVDGDGVPATVERGVARPGGILNVPLKRVGPIGGPARSRLGPAKRRTYRSRASRAFREACVSRLLPELDGFQPDIIFISAGFDAHHEDFYYWIDEKDFGWLTEQIVVIAERHCEGRVVSVLEGGYSVLPANSNDSGTPRSSGRRRTATSRARGADRSRASKVRVDLTNSAQSSGASGASIDSGSPREGAASTEPPSSEGAESSALAKSCAAHVQALLASHEAADT